MSLAQNKPVVRIAPNNPVFDLPVLVGIEEGLFDEGTGWTCRFRRLCATARRTAPSARS